MNKRVLKKATEDNATPVQGNVYDDIANMTFRSVDVCNSVLEFLVQRLQGHRSPHVKAKCLKIIKHVCRKGHQDFRKTLQRRSDPIKECCNFRGERDDLHGDKFNELVRETASECMEIIFDNSADVRVPGARISTSFPATSISSASYSAGSAGGSSYYGASAPTSISSESYNGSGGGFSGGFGSGKMEGFGPEGPGGRKQEKPKNKFMAAMSSIGSKVKGMFSRKKKKEDRNSLIHNESSLYSSPISAGVGRFEPPSIPATSSSVSYNGYGQSGGSANGSTYKASPPSTGTSSRSTSGSRNKKGKKSSSKNRRGGGDSDSTGEQGSPTSVLGERVQTLVEKLTVDSGVRVVPVRAVLTEFTDQVSNLDPKLVARALLAKLKSATPWKTKVRALSGIEALLRVDPDLWQAQLSKHLSTVNSLTSSTHSTLAERALKVSELIEPHSASTSESESETEDSEASTSASSSEEEEEEVKKPVRKGKAGKATRGKPGAGRATSKPEEPDFFNLKSGSGTGNMFSDMKPVKPATKGGSRSGGHRRQSSVSEEESESLSSSSEHDKPVSRKSAATSRRGRTTGSGKAGKPRKPRRAAAYSSSEESEPSSSEEEVKPSRRRSGSHRKSGGDHHHNPSGRSRKGSSHEKSSSSHRHHSSSTSSHKRRSHVESDSDSDPMGFGSAANKSASSTLMPFDDIFGGPTPGSAQVPPGSETGGSLTPSQKAGVIQNLFHGGMATQGTGEQPPSNMVGVPLNQMPGGGVGGAGAGYMPGNMPGQVYSTPQGPMMVMMMPIGISAPGQQASMGMGVGMGTGEPNPSRSRAKSLKSQDGDASGFDFVSSNSKHDAFDFICEEMHNASVNK